MPKKKKETRRLDDLLRDPQQLEKMKTHLYSKRPLLEEGGGFAELLQSMVNATLEGEADAHLAASRSAGRPNKRNGYTDKTILSQAGPLDIRTPRDRDGSFEPELVAKRERQLSSGLDEQILALYAQGNSVEDVRRLLQQMFSVDISAGKISAITDRILPEIETWRSRRLQRFYPVVYLDAIHFKVRHEGVYATRAFYTVYAVDVQGRRDLLGMYLEQAEGASRWAMVLADLQSRGVEDILVVCTDNLRGFTQAITEAFPGAVVQKCIVHMLRHSLRFVDDRDRKAVVADLRKIYTAATREQARSNLDAFAVTWGQKYGLILREWTAQWDELLAFVDFPPAMRRMIYTTNPVEALHRIMRKLIKGKAAWVSEQALIKQLYLSLMQNRQSWQRKAYGWKAILRDLVERYGERITSQLGGG